MKKLKTGKHYWFRQSKERIWRVCYIGIDPDNAQWFYSIDRKPIRLSKMSLESFEWKEIPEPKERCQRDKANNALAFPISLSLAAAPVKSLKVAEKMITKRLKALMRFKRTFAPREGQSQCCR